MYDAWKHPKTLSIISKIAGVDLIPVIDIEIGNINVSVQEPSDSKATVDDLPVPVTKWHVDSYPFVCVVMMSDVSNMIGGETALKTGTGETLKVRGPQMVSIQSCLNDLITYSPLGMRRRSPGAVYHPPSTCRIGRH